MNNSSPPLSADDSVLAGGGEMGALMRSIDWSRTPVGPVSSWPQSLRTAVSIMLAAKFPMYIAWGPSFTQMYNDEYRPILGATKHPAAMGGSTLDTFAEIWNIIGPMFEGVMTRAEAVGVYDFILPMDRFGFIEECRFTFSYSPVRDESGGVGGVLVTVSETTARVLSERRMAILRDIAAETAEAATVAEACTTTIEAIASDPADLPFAQLYLLSADGRTAELAASTDSTGSAPAPPGIDLDDPAAPWPLRAVAVRGEPLVIDGLHDVMRPYTDIIGTAVLDRAMVLPIERPDDAQLAGFLVAGVSPRLRLDAQYRDFIKLVAHQVGAAIENVRAMQEAKARADALAEIDRAKTIFFSNVSHEFRTPLTLMLAPLDDLLEEAKPGPFREQLEVVHRNALRLLKLVNSLLEFSRIEAGRVDAVYEATDLAASTADLASVFRSAVERAGVKLTVDCPPLDEAVWVDRDMWEKIVLNLVSNAVKFTFDGEIEVSMRRERGEAVLRVRDTGEGIPEREIPNLFTRFHMVRGTRSRTHEGSGIGLALVQELARLHGGSASAESREGEGSTFTVRIPFGNAHLPQERIEAQRVRPPTSIRSDAFVQEATQWLPRDAVQTTPAAGMPAGRVLIADDNADMRDYLRRLLSEHWEVEAVADGIELVRAAIERPADVILTDVMMPGLDGFGVVRELHANEKTRQTPIILLSARAGDEARVEGLDAGAHDYLVKPFSPRELIARVRGHLEQARSRSAEMDHTRRLQILTRAAVTINSELSLDEMFASITETARELIGTHQAMTALAAGDEPLDPLTAVAFSEKYAEWRGATRGLSADDLSEVVAGLHVPVRLSPAELDSQPRWQRLQGEGPSLRGLLAAPLAGRDGATVGFIHVSEKLSGEFDAEDEALLVQLAQLASVAIENARLYEELQKANRAKDEFLATLSHELRTPMTATLGWASMLANPSGLSDETRQLAVDTIEQSTRAQAKLIEDILDVSRISTGKLRLRLEQVDLARVVATAAEAVRPAAAAKNVRLELTLGELHGAVAGDPARLQQVIWNLLQNAIKFTPPGGSVDVTLVRNDSQAVLTVTDSGEGISADFLPFVFERFRQADSGAKRQYGGLGLGLTIVKTLIERHGGTVRASSPGPGKGATFTVVLPLGDASAVTAIASGQPMTLRDLDVLLVEDDEPTRVMLATALETFGARVRAMSSVPDAILALDQAWADVLVSDVALPGQDGYSLIRHVRASLRPGRLHAIALTAHARQEDRASLLEAGFDLFLPKPIEPQFLVSAIQRLRTGEVA
jgi:signal transduction histidine kinase